MKAVISCLSPLLALSLLSACVTGASNVATDSETDSKAALHKMRGDRVGPGLDFAKRSAVVAPSGAAATAHPLATQIALDTLKAGGNAVDAAIAANAMLGLVEPTGNGIGGDLFAMVWDPKTEKLYGLNGSGRSPMGATLADMQAKADKFMDGEELPPFGAAPVTVPGTVDGWFMMHEKFGKMPMSRILAPTVDYARKGAPIPEVIAWYWTFGPKRFEPAFESGMLEEYENAKKTFFSPAPVEGSLFRNPDLANTLEQIGRQGRDVFYKGSQAGTMDAYFKRIGGYLRYQDFADHKGEWVDPICVTYRISKVCQLPPNTQGVAALQMLEMLEGFDIKGMGFGSPDSIMAQVEAKRLAFEDRALSYTDPAFSGIDPLDFVKPGYNEALSEKIDLANANPTPQATLLAIQEADKKLKDGDTTYLTVADKDGMMVSLIQSNYRGMGSGLVPDGLGFMFQDRGQLFSLHPDHPNVFEPGKRPFHTIIPGFAFKQDMPGCQVASVPMDQACPYLPWLSFGLMGGGMQPQGHVQIILNLIDYEMGLQEAGDAARWRHDGGCEPTDDFTGDPCETDMGTIRLESGFYDKIADDLRARGHKVEPGNGGFGGYQAIMRDFDHGTWIAATEMRKDGMAGGY